jgi:glutathione S-transferase/autophagy-related protein 2
MCSLKIFGVPLSQPTRSVAWACLIKKIPFKMKIIVPGSDDRNGSCHPEFLALNPVGQVPVIEDSGVVIAEANAILPFLASRYGWTDLYPEDPVLRARIDWFLHAQHSGLRFGTYAYLQPFLRPDKKVSGGERTLNCRRFDEAVSTFNDFWLSNGPFIGGQSLSIADIVAYGDVGQLQISGVYDFGKLPAVEEWLSMMTEIAHHDVANSCNLELGKLTMGQAVTSDLLISANKRWMKEVRQLQTVHAEDRD